MLLLKNYQMNCLPSKTSNIINFIPGSRLQNLPHHKMSPKEHKILLKMVEELLQKQHIEESLNPCVVPALLVPKKDETCKLCIDNRVVNKITVKYRFSILRPDDMLDNLGGSTIISKLDLKSGYHPI